MMFIPKMQGLFNIWTEISVTHYISKLKWKTVWLFQCMQKKHWQNPVSIPDTDPQQPWTRRELVQPDTGCAEKVNSAGLGCSNPAHSQERPVSMTVLCLAPENWTPGMVCLMSVSACLKTSAILHQSVQKVYTRSVIYGEFLASGDLELQQLRSFTKAL